MKNKKPIITILWACLVLSLSSCNDGNTPNAKSINQNNNKNLSNFNQSVSTDFDKLTVQQFLSKVCGGDENGELRITEADDSTLNPNFILSKDDRALSATVVCENGAQKDVTFLANWISADKKIFTVSNTSEEKGYVTTIAPGSATLRVSITDPLYSAQAKITVSKEAVLLDGIKVYTSRAEDNNTIAKGEQLDVIVEGHYSDGSVKKLNNVTLMSNSDSIKIDGNTITGIKPGKYSLTAKVEAYTSSLDGEVLPAKVVGLRLVEDNFSAFSIALPRTEALKAKLELSDGSVIDLPKPTFDKPTNTECKLYRLPSETSVPFYNDGNSCNITSTAEVGENKITMYYQILNPKDPRDILETLESSLIIDNSDSDIKNIRVALINDIGSTTVTIGEPYRFRVFADLINGKSMDVTKVSQSTAIMLSGTKDISDKIIVANIGYTGPLDGKDDGKGGVIKITDYPVADHLNIAPLNIKLISKLGKFESSITTNTKLIPPVLSLEYISKYFVDNVYKKTSPAERQNIVTYSGYDTSGNLNITDASNVLTNFSSNYISVSGLTSSLNTINVDQASSSKEYAFERDIITPRVSYGENNPSWNMVSVLCNNSAINQNLTSQTKSQKVSNTTGMSRGFSVGLEIGSEVAIKVPGIGDGKRTVKVNTKYDQSWSHSETNEETATLPQQTILVPPYGKAVVIQKVYKSVVSYLGSFDLPLTNDSCIPFMQTANLPYLHLNSLSCMPFKSLSVNDQFLDEIFTTGKHNMRFTANVTANGYDKNATYDGNTVNVYILTPTDDGYNQLQCDKNGQLNTTNTTLSADGKSLNVGNSSILLNAKNLNQKMIYQ